MNYIKTQIGVKYLEELGTKRNKFSVQTQSQIFPQAENARPAAQSKRAFSKANEIKEYEQN